MGKFATSWGLMKESLEVLKKDKEILLFPVLSAVFCIVAFLVMVFPLVFTSQGGNWTIGHIVTLYLFFFVTNGIVIFFNTATIFCARKRLQGADPTLGDGFRGAFSRIGPILAWALISATVGLILRWAREKSEGVLGRIAVSLLGAAWEFVTFFVIPVYAFEKVGPFAAIKRSASLIKKTWGENLITSFSIGFAMMILYLIAIPVVVIAFLINPAAGLVAAGLGILYWVLLAVIGASLSGVFTAALYEYATKGKVPEGFSQDHITGVFAHKDGTPVRHDSPLG